MDTQVCACFLPYSLQTLVSGNFLPVTSSILRDNVGAKAAAGIHLAEGI